MFIFRMEHELEGRAWQYPFGRQVHGRVCLMVCNYCFSATTHFSDICCVKQVSQKCNNKSNRQTGANISTRNLQVLHDRPLNERHHFAGKVKVRCQKRNQYKLRLEVLLTIGDALRINKENSTNLWKLAIEEEMKNSRVTLSSSIGMTGPQQETKRSLAASFLTWI